MLVIENSLVLSWVRLYVSTGTDRELLGLSTHGTAPGSLQHTCRRSGMSGPDKVKRLLVSGHALCFELLWPTAELPSSPFDIPPKCRSSYHLMK